MNTYHFDVILYNYVSVVTIISGEVPNENVHAEINAPTEHLARRRVMDDMLGRGIFIKSIKLMETYE